MLQNILQLKIRLKFVCYGIRMSGYNPKYDPTIKEGSIGGGSVTGGFCSCNCHP